MGRAGVGRLASQTAGGRARALAQAGDEIIIIIFANSTTGNVGRQKIEWPLDSNFEQAGSATGATRIIRLKVNDSGAPVDGKQKYLLAWLGRLI